MGDFGNRPYIDIPVPTWGHRGGGLDVTPAPEHPQAASALHLIFEVVKAPGYQLQRTYWFRLYGTIT